MHKGSGLSEVSQLGPYQVIMQKRDKLLAVIEMAKSTNDFMYFVSLKEAKVQLTSDDDDPLPVAA